MFIYCFDKDLQYKLINKGFKIFKGITIQNGCVFIYDKKIKFDFDCIDKTKFTICDKFNF